MQHKRRKTVGNYLKPENCNKAKCKTCIFGKTPLKLPIERLNEIHQYLATGKSSHICHTSNLTCYGALEFQANILHRLGIITEPTAEALLEAANLVLSKVKK